MLVFYPTTVISEFLTETQTQEACKKEIVEKEDIVSKLQVPIKDTMLKKERVVQTTTYKREERNSIAKDTRDKNQIMQKTGMDTDSKDSKDKTKEG